MRFEKLLLAAAASASSAWRLRAATTILRPIPNRTKRPERRVRGREMEMTTPENRGTRYSRHTRIDGGCKGRRILQGRLSRRRDGQLLDQLHRRRRERSRRLLYPLPRFQRFAGGRPRFRGAGRQRLSDECREWLSGRNAQRRRRHLSGAPRRRGRFHLFRGAERFGQGRDDRGPL